MIFKVTASALCVALSAGAAQSACEASLFITQNLDEIGTTFTVLNRAELNDYTARNEAIRQAQLEALAAAVYCHNSKANNDNSVFFECELGSAELNPQLNILTDYSLSSQVICADQDWLYLQSVISLASSQ